MVYLTFNIQHLHRKCSSVEAWAAIKRASEFSCQRGAAPFSLLLTIHPLKPTKIQPKYQISEPGQRPEGQISFNWKLWKLKSTVVLVIGPVFSYELVHTFEENGSAPTTLSGYGILSRFKPKKTWNYTCFAKSVLCTGNTNCMQRYTTWLLNIHISRGALSI